MNRPFWEEEERKNVAYYDYVSIENILERFPLPPNLPALILTKEEKVIGQQRAFEMARELVGLPRYIAYTRIVGEKGREPIVWKGKIQTSKLTDVREDVAEAARLSVVKNMPVYCRPRGQIQGEIAARQERWRTKSRTAETIANAGEEKQGKQPPAETRVVHVERDEPPPPTSVSVKKAGGKPEKYEKQPAEAQKVSQDPGIPESFTVQKPARRATDESPKARLVYQSDFTKPTGWDEEHSDNVKVFRLDGYYHIAVYEALYWAWFCPSLIMDDFRVHVDAKLNIQAGKLLSVALCFAREGEWASPPLYVCHLVVRLFSFSE